jgi:hypothetical protein
MEHAPDWLERGFHMAYYTVPDRLAAIEMVANAFEKLRVHVKRETKRFYWRDKHIGRPIRRITRQAGDLLQWLIMVESEHYERKQEEAGLQSATSMAIRYVKHLIQLTSAASSFHVNVALSRLLYNYTTAETQALYEMPTSRYPGSDEYRRVKNALMRRISQRFDSVVRATRTAHGEFRYQALANQDDWVNLVEECLTVFTPWSTVGSCSRFAGPNGNAIKLPVNRDIFQDDAEMSCCHLFIDPVCFKRLTEALSLDPPERRLALPQFYVKDENNPKKGGPVPELSSDERQAIIKRVSDTDVRRRLISPAVTRIVVDGAECTRFDMARERTAEIAVEDGAKLVEVWSHDVSGDLLLATFSIAYAGSCFAFSKAILSLRSGKLQMIVRPKPTIDDAARATITFEYQPSLLTLQLRTFHDFIEGLLRAIRQHALPSLVSLIIGIGVATVALRPHKTNTEGPFVNQTGTVVSYVLIPDDQRVRTANSDGSSDVALSEHRTIVDLELVADSLPHPAKYRADLKTLTEDNEILSETLYTHQTQERTRIALQVPAALLQANKYYTVHLSLIEPGGKEFQESARYSFRTVPGL